MSVDGKWNIYFTIYIIIYDIKTKTIYIFQENFDTGQGQILRCKEIQAYLIKCDTLFKSTTCSYVKVDLSGQQFFIFFIVHIRKTGLS